MGNYGWIEIVFFYGVALSLCIWQYVKMDRDLKRTKAERAKREAEQSDSVADNHST